MKISLDEEFFDLTCRILNYAIEFVNAPGYASLRFLDVLERLIELQPKIEGISSGEFYQKMRRKLESRDLFRARSIATLGPLTRAERSKLLNELLTIFMDEWRNIPFG